MMGTFLPGVLMQVLVNGGTSTKVALTWGFRLNLIWSVFGLLFLGIATIYAEKQVREEGGSQSPTPGPELFSPTAGKQNGERATLATGGGGDSAIQMCHNPMDRQGVLACRGVGVCTHAVLTLPSLWLCAPSEIPRAPHVRCRHGRERRLPLPPARAQARGRELRASAAQLAVPLLRR